MNNLKIIGTTHLANPSEIISEIKKFKPDIIGVELCESRFNTLVMNKLPNEIKEDDSLLGQISKSLKEKAEKENIQYGSDMITASRYALDNKIKLQLVDRKIEEIQNLFLKIPQDEQSGFIKELEEFNKLEIKESMKNIDENKVLEELRTKYPIAYEFLIVSREIHIAFNILKLIKDYPKKKVLIFIGKGHLIGVNKLLE